MLFLLFGIFITFKAYSCLIHFSYSAFNPFLETLLNLLSSFYSFSLLIIVTFLPLRAPKYWKYKKCKMLASILLYLKSIPLRWGTMSELDPASRP